MVFCFDGCGQSRVVKDRRRLMKVHKLKMIRLKAEEEEEIA